MSNEYLVAIQGIQDQLVSLTNATVANGDKLDKAIEHMDQKVAHVGDRVTTIEHDVIRFKTVGAIFSAVGTLVSAVLGFFTFDFLRSLWTNWHHTVGK